MNTSEKLKLLLQAINGEVEIEIAIHDKWTKVKWSEREDGFIEGARLYRVDGVILCDFRAIPKLPLLTEEECTLLSFYDSKWWIFRDKDERLFVSLEQPLKRATTWRIDASTYAGLNVRTFPKFENIKWYDGDCYTIGELIEYSKGQKR
jgi:hypothetical protein